MYTCTHPGGGSSVETDHPPSFHKKTVSGPALDDLCLAKEITATNLSVRVTRKQKVKDFWCRARWHLFFYVVVQLLMK